MGARRVPIVVVTAATLIGGLAWRGHEPLLVLSALLPLLVMAQPNRAWAALTALGYYLAASWPLVNGAAFFFGWSANPAPAIALWFTASVILMAPWLAFWGKTGYTWRIPLALLLGCIPPIGIIGWASPLTAAGIFYPGFGLMGVLLLLLLIDASSRHDPRALALLVPLAVTANIVDAFCPRPTPPPTWTAINTTFGRGATEFETSEHIQHAALQTKAHVIVFPEAVVHRWTETTEAFWQQTLSSLESSGKTMLIGAGLPIPGSLDYRNALVITGKQAASPFLQRIPVPLGMWKPFTKGGVPLNLATPGTITIDGERAAILVCYEQLLTFPILASALERPTILIGIADNHWAAGTVIPKAQATCLRAWARLFQIPYISAMNT